MPKMAGITASRRAKAHKRPPGFDLQGFLDSEDSRTITKFAKASNHFLAGGSRRSGDVHPAGSVKLSVLSKTGKEAIVAMLSPGDFFGEGCLAGQTRRMSTATAMAPTTVSWWSRSRTMMQMLHEAAGAVRSLHGPHARAQHPRSKRTSSISSSTRARSGWRARCC